MMVGGRRRVMMMLAGYPSIHATGWGYPVCLHYRRPFDMVIGRRKDLEKNDAMLLLLVAVSVVAFFGYVPGIYGNWPLTGFIQFTDYCI